MSNLQLGMIIAGVVLVLGVVIFNAWQERRIRRRIEAAFHPGSEATTTSRVEPTLKPAAADSDDVGGSGRRDSLRAGAAPRSATAGESSFVPPMDIIEHGDVGSASDAQGRAPVTGAPPDADDARPFGPQPDPDIESIITLQPVKPVTVGELAAGLHARVGKPIRWFGRKDANAPWQLLQKDTSGTFAEIVACMLLADRNGAASQAQLESFARSVGDLAAGLPAEVAVPSAASEAARGEALDRLCADMDVQIGLTVVKPDPAAIPGTRLRGVAEAAGFRLAGGRFEYMHEDTGTIEYSLQNVRSEPFTAEMLRATATPGVVFVLDVPRVSDPTRTFDRMKMAAKRMAKTLNANIVDDNRRPLDDAALTAIRGQVEAAAIALKHVHIEPGSARALALFGA
jgi:FtsZ-interacting cell division protein ZipA